MPDPFAGHVAPDPAAGPEIPPDAAPGQFAVSRSPAGPLPTLGRIVHYALSEHDIHRLALAATAGEAVPAIVVGVADYVLSLHAFPDAPRSFWVQPQGEGTEPGQWSWPPAVEAQG